MLLVIIFEFTSLDRAISPVCNFYCVAWWKSAGCTAFTESTEFLPNQCIPQCAAQKQSTQTNRPTNTQPTTGQLLLSTEWEHKFNMKTIKKSVSPKQDIQSPDSQQMSYLLTGSKKYTGYGTFWGEKLETLTFFKLKLNFQFTSKSTAKDATSKMTDSQFLLL